MIKFPDIRRGDDRDLLATGSFAVGTLVGCEVEITFKDNPFQSDASAALQMKSTRGEIEIVSATEMLFKFSRVKTSLLKVKQYRVDVQIKTPSGKVVTGDDLESYVTVVEDFSTRT